MRIGEPLRVVEREKRPRPICVPDWPKTKPAETPIPAPEWPVRKPEPAVVPGREVGAW